MPNFWKKKIKSAKKIADITGIDEQKIKELKNGERNIEGETMNKILNAINEDNKKTDLEKAVEQEEILKWFKETDFGKLIKDFGYKSQREVSKAIGTSPGNLSFIITGLYKRCTPTHKKIYDFFHDDFNKKINKKVTDKNKGTIKKDIKDIVETFFKENEMSKLQKELNVSNNYQLAEIAGCSRSTLQNAFAGRYIYVSETMIKAYNNLQKALNSSETKEKVVEPTKEPEMEEKVEVNVITPGDSKTDVNEPKNEEKQDNTETKEEIVTEKKKISYKELKRRNKLLKKRVKEEIAFVITLLTKIEKKDKQIETLKKQIARYEILIDRLK